MNMRKPQTRYPKCFALGQFIFMVIANFEDLGPTLLVLNSERCINLQAQSINPKVRYYQVHRFKRGPRPLASNVSPHFDVKF
uniref:Uncharacterized protein n=1 Tax=Pyxicephalus adspersus TaxID=30357 RepID=A0AAV3B3V6_PYXAD|nr:TPA: hypothetical protein GDO54_001354 [Pyxicephalus adspersus]